MKCTILLALSLVAGMLSQAQVLPVLKAHSYYEVGPGGSLTIGDSLVHFHSKNRKSIAKPTAQNHRYPANGVYADDSTVSFDVINGGANMAYYSRKFNAAGLPTVYTEWQAFFPGIWKQIVYTYNSQLQPDTTTFADDKGPTSRMVHEYQNGKLTGIRGYSWSSIANGWVFGGVDSFIAAGPGSDSSFIRYSWNGSTLQPVNRHTYVRDAANRILTDSVFTNGLLTHFLRYTYNTQGRLVADTTFGWIPAQSQTYFASKKDYLYDAQSNLAGIKNSIWYSVWATFVSVSVDSFKYNKFGQVTSFMRYDSTATGRVPVVGSNAQFFYYDTTLNVQDAMPEGNLQLYPVPATTYINLSMSFSQPQAFSVRIFDMQGRLVSQWQEGSQRTYNKQIPLTGMAPGQYVVHILAGKETSSVLFMVVK